MKSEPRAPLCYSCRHVRDVPGSAHKSCAAGLPEMGGESLVNLSRLLSKPARARVTERAQEEPVPARFAEQGVRGGWALWPFNFDPVWLQECSVYEDRESPEPADDPDPDDGNTGGLNDDDRPDPPGYVEPEEDDSNA